MTHHYIPFANSATDWPLINSYYSEAAGCRVTLQSLKKARNEKLPTPKLWLDTEVDGLDSPEVFTSNDTGYQNYRGYISQFENAQKIADPKFQLDPEKAEVEAFVNSVLRSAEAVPNVRWFSVPQLPYTPGRQRRKINKVMAELTRQWWSASSKLHSVQLILPVIFAKKRGQTDTKTDRNAEVELAVACFNASRADGVWIVDSTLDDQEGIRDFENKRFPGIIKFHEELGAKLPAETKTVAGPYWGLNLVLWARGVVRCPAVGVGRSYQYYVPGRQPKSAKTRIALDPLKRLAVCSDLRPWLDESLRTLTKNDPVYRDFATLLKKLEYLQLKDNARKQVAEFYRDWLLKLESVPTGGRALTLYQDFSSAYVLGRKLNKRLPQEEVTDPALIAKQLMVNCL